MNQHTSEQINELSAALAKAQGEIKGAAKATLNTYFTSKYADLAACVDVAKEPLSKNGLSVMQVVDADEAGNMRLVTYLTHSSGQWMRSIYPIKPVKNDPQGVGSAITYARRYSYCAIVGVVAENEDDDGNAASDKPAKPPAFKTAAARKQYVQNVIDSIQACQSAKEVENVAALNRDKIKEMKASGNEHDDLGADEIIKEKAMRLAALNNKAMDDEFKERV